MGEDHALEPFEVDVAAVFAEDHRPINDAARQQLDDDEIIWSHDRHVPIAVGKSARHSPGECLLLEWSRGQQHIKLKWHQGVSRLKGELQDPLPIDHSQRWLMPRLKACIHNSSHEFGDLFRHDCHKHVGIAGVACVIPRR